MSKGSRIAIGVVAIIAAIGFLNSAMNPASVKAAPIVFYGLAAFCGVIAIACFSHKAHPVTLRIIGGTVFATFAVYAYDSIINNPRPMQAICGFLVWGLPSGYLAIKGKYPDWGMGAAGINANQNKK
jgi:FtsH-binding integral membrane protein